MDNLLLELKLDTLINDKLIDTSGPTPKTSKTMVNGAKVAMDDTFGSILHFNGKGDFLKLPMVNGIKAISLWVNSSDSIQGPWKYLLDPRPTPQGLWVANKNLNGNWTKMLIDGREAALTWKNIPKNKWVHIYLEAKEKFSSAIHLMARFNEAEFGKGKLSYIRLFSEALTLETIEEQIQADRSVMNTYRALNPLDFNMWNGKQEKTLTINDDGSGVSMWAEIINTSTNQIELKGTKDTPTSKNFHFSFHFRPGVLRFEKNGIQVPSNWSITSDQGDGKRVNVFVNSLKDITIAPKDVFELQLNGLVAERLYGSRGTQVELQYSNLNYKGKQTILQGNQIAYLDIISHIGKENIPLHVGFIGSNTILNDSATENELRLRITNISKDNTIKFQSDKSEGDKDSRFTFNFISHKDSKDSILTSKSGIKMSVNGQNLGPEGGQSETGTWVYELNSNLEAGSSIDVLITEVVCDKPSGIANLYIKYEDIPGYWDGKFVLEIEKSPLIVRNQDGNGNPYGEERVGIGTDDPKTKLYVSGGLTVTENTNLMGPLGPIIGPASDYMKAQTTLSGGGTVTWADNHLKWTQRFIAIAMGTNASFSQGHINLSQPGKVKNSDGTEQVVSADGILLNKWEALYAVHTVGGNASAVEFQIQHYTKEINLPSNWILIGVVNGDKGNYSIKLGNGVTLNPNTSSTNSSPIPVGVIMMWSGAINTIPGGWALCNGKKGTPNLIDRFVIGASSATHPVNKTGGSNEVILNKTQIPSHKHKVNLNTNSRGNHRHYMGTRGYDSGNSYRGADGSYDDKKSKTQYAGSHTHNINGWSAASGGSKPHENRPLFWALAYIMKL